MPSSACKTCALRSEEHTSELPSHDNLVCRLLLAKKKVELRGAIENRFILGNALQGVYSACRAFRAPAFRRGRRCARPLHSTVFFFLRIRRPRRPPPFPYRCP